MYVWNGITHKNTVGAIFSRWLITKKVAVNSRISTYVPLLPIRRISTAVCRILHLMDNYLLLNMFLFRKSLVFDISLTLRWDVMLNLRVFAFLTPHISESI